MSVACPACSGRAPARGRCPECGHATAVSARPSPATLLRSVRLVPDDDVERTADGVAAALGADRFPARVSNSLNLRLASRRYVRLVVVDWASDERDLIAVCTRDWSDRLVERLSADLLSLDQVEEAAGRLRRWFFAVAHEPPRMLRYAFSNDLRARFQRAALCRVQYTSPEEIVPVARIPVLLELAAALARDHLGLVVRPGSVSEVERIETAVFRHLRRDLPRSRDMPKGEFVPYTSLLLLGLLYGEALGGGLGVRRRWVISEKAPFGLGLSLRSPGGSAERLHDPVRRVCRLHLKGERESLVTDTWALQALFKARRGA